MSDDAMSADAIEHAEDQGWSNAMAVLHRKAGKHGREIKTHQDKKWALEYAAEVLRTEHSKARRS